MSAPLLDEEAERRKFELACKLLLGWSDPDFERGPEPTKYAASEQRNAWTIWNARAGLVKATPTFQTLAQRADLHSHGAFVKKDSGALALDFLARAVELAKVAGVSSSEATSLVDKTLERQRDEFEILDGGDQRAVGAVMIELARLSSALGLEMDAAGNTELERRAADFE